METDNDITMKASEVLQFHKLLWRETPPSQVEFKGKTYSVFTIDSTTRSFRSCNVGKISIVTQNLKKPSSNTRWVLEDKRRQLSWIFVDNNYHGKVSAEPMEDELVYKVWKLNPDRIVLQDSDPL